ncbi:MAG: T9SS type A sorting domain-containing protein, partial [Saprospiraceae bacterium]|nr:T9SS type A sorting domain-containing protein [Saprospiraceae bacterium]
LNSLLARDTMQARGATDLIATDVNTTADHGGCVSPALTNTVFFFLGYQQVGVFTGASELAVQPLQLQPNPANSFVLLKNLPADGQLELFAADGRLVRSGAVSAGDYRLETAGLEEGWYLLRVWSEGKIWQGRLVVQH